MDNAHKKLISEFHVFCYKLVPEYGQSKVFIYDFHDLYTKLQ